MKIRIISRLSILMETVEMLYKYVNNLSLDNIKRDFLLKYGGAAECGGPGVL